ncbi:MAG: hypothetical protein WCB96_00785 [Candidatus Aminicenantales bacterium]
MIDEQQKEALENISLIKDLITESRKELQYTGGGWIAIIWGLYCLLGYGGQQLFALDRLYDWAGLWWVALSVPAFFLSVLVIRNRAKTQSVKLRRTLTRAFLLFWVPLLMLMAVLIVLCLVQADLPDHYLVPFILLVVSTGYLMLGLLFQRSILVMGLIGFAGTVAVTLLFIEQAGLLLSLLFGIGLIVTGLVLNRKR